MMTIVAISRQVGSYGDIIAAMMAQNLGLELVGRDRVHELAQLCDPEYKAASAAYEAEQGPALWERIFYDRPVYTSLFEALTFEQAARGDVIIVGRGSQVIFGNIPSVFKVRVVASSDKRIHRIMERYNFSESEADDFVQRYDQERENLVRFIFHRDPRDCSLYDIIINTDNYTAAAACEIAISALEKMRKPDDESHIREHLHNMALAKRIETLLKTRLTSSVTRNVGIEVESGGVVKIIGRVLDKRAREEVEKLTLEYPGISKVQNELKFANLTFGI